MKRFILAFMLLALILPLAAKEKIVFESVLKDAEFRPLYAFEVTYEETLPSMGWWTLKFENGAVITVYRARLELSKDDVWFIGKKYKVTRKGLGKNYFFVYLDELVGIEWVDKKVQKRLVKEAKKEAKKK
ncbi:hypothetical protein ES707_18986 [subsurface metagenome]